MKSFRRTSFVRMLIIIVDHWISDHSYLIQLLASYRPISHRLHRQHSREANIDNALFALVAAYPMAVYARLTSDLASQVEVCRRLF
jgi:hypothetical protein